MLFSDYLIHPMLRQGYNSAVWCRSLVILMISLGAISRLGAQTYTVNQTGTYAIESNNPVTVSLSENSIYEIPIGFNFSFFGDSYSTCYIAQNGFITFDSGSGDGCCAGQLIPDAADPNNLIAVAWTDQDTAIIQYEVLGTSPYRRLVITFNLQDNCDATYFGQVKMFETTNVIEIHSQQWAQSNTPCNNTTQGLENIDGNVAIQVPGRNSNTNWSIDTGDNDVVSFTPHEVYIVEHNANFVYDEVNQVEIPIYEDGFAEVPIGFEFDFFGSSYSNCSIGNNGFIAFGPTTDGGCCEGELLPDPSDPNNLIAAAWMHAWQSECCIEGNAYNYYYYETIGTAPNRRFVVSYYIEDLDCAAYYVGQVKLFEGTNVIEIHTDFYAEGGPPCTPVTQGIENGDGTQAYFLEGRNASMEWEVPCCEGDVVRFTPVSSFSDFDAGVSEIVDDPVCAGQPAMSVLVKNYGAQDIDSVTVHWTWNGVAQTPVVSNTDILAGSDPVLVDLDTQQVVFGNTYQLKAWTSLPNNMVDAVALNDTMTSTIAAGLHGTFTIGGSSPTYTTFAAAVNDLVAKGVCDDVVFNVRPGTYVGQISIPFINGAKDDNIITFQAENGDSASVILQFSATSSTSNYVVRLDGAENILWQKMTIKALGTTNSRVIELRNGSDNNVIAHCAIEGRNAATTSSANACIFSDEMNNDNTILSNTIRYGSYGFYHDDGIAKPERYLISQNKFIDFYYRGIYTYKTKSLKIYRNTLESSKANVRGIDVTYDNDSITISHNKIYLTLGTHGIRLSTLFSFGNKRAKVFNNMVNVAGTNCIAGLELSNCDRVDVMHNTVNISIATAGRYAYLHDGQVDSVFNNIFSNPGGGPIISVTDASLSAFDFNNYHGTGNVFGNYGGIEIENLDQWRSTSSFDQNALYKNPLFVSSTDLHTTSSFLNGKASPAHTRPDDYDLQSRNQNAPDIGADEFTPGANDAAITGVLSPVVSCDSMQNITVVLTNLGSATLDNVTIKWKLNGVAQSDVVYTQDLMPEGDTAHVTLTTYSFAGQPVNFRFWTTLPNGSADAQPANDTLDFRFRLPLSGTYTIGGTNPDFTTFTAAVNDLNQFHTCGPVIMAFRNGTYTEQVKLDSIPTLSAINTIIFESENQDSSLVSLQWTVVNSNKQYNILLNGTDYVTFRHLGFKTLTAGDAAAIETKNYSHHLTFSNNHFEGTLVETQYANNYLFKALTGKQEYLTFENNYFLGATYAIRINNLEGSGDLRPREFHFDDNTFVNQKASSITVSNMKDLYIRNNTISTTTNFSGRRIETNTLSGYSEISGNTITNLNTGACLYMNFTNYSYGGESHVFNNMARTGGSEIPLNFWNCRNINISHNNARSAGNGDAVHVGGGDTVALRNNVFMANSGNAYSIFTPPATFISDYNDLYSVSGSIAYRSNFYNTLVDWNAGTGYDAHSISIDPQYASSTDLHVFEDTLDGSAIPIAGINTDIDGQTRDMITPDIGADEIGAEELDAGIRKILPEMPFAKGLQDIKMVIRNFGSDTLLTATISWKINGVSQPDYYYSGPLASLQQDTIIIGQHDFDLNTAYIIKAWTSIPNQGMDMDHANDTLQNSAIYAAVSGDVVIGPTGDLTTIASTISAMNNGGVIGSIRFRIQQGTYHESLVMPAASYQSCVNPIIYESFTGNAADVIWDNVGTGTHTILLDGADGIKFRHLTIKTTINAIQAIRFQNGSSCNVIEYCSIDGVTTANNTNTYAPIFATSTNGNASTYNNNNTIAFTTINNGSYSIYWAGGNGTTGLLIKNNTLVNARAFGMSLNNLTAPVAEYNSITTNVNVAYVGIQLNICTGQSKINGNIVTLTASRTTQAIGIQLASSSGTSPLPIIVSNNYVIIGNGPNPAGLHINVGTFIQVLHNTLRIAGGTSTLRCLYVQGTTTNTNNLTIRNNIFDSEASGYTTYYTVAYNNNFTTSHNGHYTAGTNKIFYAINYTNFTTWQNTGQDANSVFLDPEYDPDAPLSYRVVNAGFDGTAMPVTYVTTDIENQLRNATMPDMGCDEFDLFTHDVGLVSISYPYQPFPEGTNTVFIKFDNNGEDTLTSMQVHWEIDDVPQPVYQWSGLLPSAATYDSLDIGDYDFTQGEYHYIKVWVSHPNGVQDQLAVNDTLSIDSLYPALSGIYTIGGVDPDFETISGAVFELNKGGAFGEVTFNIRPGTYLEPISINDFPGSDCNTPVIFQSETSNASDVLITNLGYNAYTIVLNGADGVIFQNLGITSVNPAYRIVISYANGAHCNQFLNNQITGYESTSTSATAAVIHSATGADTANVFTGNDIKYGSYSFYLLGHSSAIANTTIQDNILYHPYYRGVYASLESGISIDKNQITPVATNSRGIDLNECHTLTGISGNVISSSGQYGIFINNSDGLSSAQGLISNNFISVGGTSTARGIYLSLSDYQRVLHNNIHVYSTNGTLANTAPLYVSGCASTTIKNNALSNGGPGYAIFSNNNTAFIANHNTYYATGVSLGYWNGISTATIADWRTSSGQDANSLDVNPQFMSNTDLHVSNILLNGTGQFTSPVTEDIDGDVRSNPPDIGADEFDPSLANDAGVFMVLGPMIPFAPGSQPVTIAVKNFGAEPLTTVNIRWVVNGLEQPPYSWTGSLGPAQCDTVILGNYTFSPYSDHDITLWTELPNNAVDSASLNDTITVTNLYPAMSGMYTIGGVLPDFNLLSQLEVALNTGGIMGDVTLLFRNGTYAAQLAIQDFPHTSNNFRVRFTSESGDSSLVTWTRNFNVASANNYTIRLNNAHRIDFDHLTLASTKGKVIDVINGSSDISIDHCQVIGVNLSDNNAAYSLISSGTTSEDSITITNNLLRFGDYGIYLIGSAGDPELNINISGNAFENCFTESINTRYTSGLRISENSIMNNENRHNGIFAWNAAGSPDISRNDIRLLAGSIYGINLFEIYGAVSIPASINNNYIFITNLPGTNAYGIKQKNGDYVNYNYNTIRLKNTGAAGSAFLGESTSNHTHFRNCIFSNESGGPAFDVPWIPGNNTNSINYSNLYTTGPILVTFYFDYTDHTSFQGATNENLQGKNVDPIFTADEPEIFQSALDGSGVPIAGVVTDIYGNTRHASAPDIGAREFTLLAHDIGARSLTAPVTYCGLSGAEEVTIRIQNYGASEETGFDVSYSLDGSAWVTENVGALQISPGSYQDYTFTDLVDLDQPGEYSFTIRTSMGSDLNLSNDTLWDVNVLHIPALQLPPTNLLPVNGQTNLETTVSLSWAPAPNATVYDVYVWLASQSPPVTPQISNLTQINTQITSLTYGAMYSWKVVAKNVCNQMVSSSINGFSIRNLPNLQVDTVIAPVTAFSGQSIQIQWQVKNTGPGSTLSTGWSDAVFLSTDATLNVSYDTYIGAVQNLTALAAGVTYTQTASFTIPNGFTGTYYVFVYSDRWNNLLETDNTNNWDRTVALTQIQMVPLPDLKVQSIAATQTTFSGQTIAVQYEIKNIGLANTNTSAWRDRIIFHSDPVNYAGGTVISTLLHQGILAPDSSYTRSVNVTVPQGIFGLRYVYVITDWLGEVYENAGENNNVQRSDTIEVFLTPPPDIVITEINFPDTVHNNQDVPMSYIMENQGGSTITISQWKDQLSFSASPIYNSNFLMNSISKVNFGPIAPFDPRIYGVYTKVPMHITGPHYLYIKADNENKVFEFNNESNNISRTQQSFIVINPDLQVSNVSYEDTITSGHLAIISWDLINNGPGNLIQRKVNTKVYLSTQLVFNEASAIWLSTHSNTIDLLPSDDTLSFTLPFRMPAGFTGLRYIHVVTDSDQSIFENGLEGNNVGIGSPTFVQLPPYPDLVPQQINVPDTVIAGEVFSLNYEVHNIGTADALQASTDSIFLSFSPVWDPLLTTRLGKFAASAALNTGDSVYVEMPVFIPLAQNSNVYYVYIKSDANSKVFEHTGESNNIQRSDPFFIKPPLPVDLRPGNISIADDTISTGSLLQINYSIANLGQRSASGVGWFDGGYLSVDTILQPEIDTRFFNQNLTTRIIPAGQSSNQVVTAVVPQGLTGDYYLLVRTDDLNALGDINYLNNTAILKTGNIPQAIHIELSPTIDLNIAGFDAPITAIAGQPVQISLNTANAGTTSVHAWKTKFYLSTDNIINGGDVVVATKNYAEALEAGDTITTLINLNIPVSAYGNYYLIAQVDADGIVYEYNGEQNNIQLRTISIVLPPPSDLIVTAIAMPDSAYAGDTATVSWVTRNIGSYPASGVFREIIYFSTDTILDVDDPVFAIRDTNNYIPPGYSISKEFNAPLNGMSNLDYYALIQTDARNNIHELSDDNNVGLSASTLNISIEELMLDSVTADVVQNGTENYFRLEIPYSLEGENLQITIDGDSLASYNEMYLKYGTVPTPSIFDANHLYPFQPDQELVMEDIQAGTYYIMVRGYTTVDGHQDVTLLARIIDFELLSVKPDRLARGMQTTIELFGTQMDTLRNVYLVRDSTIRILADSIIGINSQRAYATFTIDSVPFYNLTEVPLGYFDVQAERWDGKIAELIDGVEIVEQGTGPSLQFVIDHPGEVSRWNRPMKITIFIQNSGDADIVGQNFIFEAPWGNHVAFTLDELLAGATQTSLVIPIQGAFGPPGILPPKGSNIIEVYAFSGPHPTFALTPLNE